MLSQKALADDDKSYNSFHERSKCKDSELLQGSYKRASNEQKDDFC